MKYQLKDAHEAMIISIIFGQLPAVHGLTRKGMMNDESFLLLTKRRLYHIKNQSLEHQAIRVILHNAHFYLKSFEQKLKMQNLREFQFIKKFKCSKYFQIARVLREKLLQEMLRWRCRREKGDSKKFDDLMEVFRILLSTRTRRVELNGILSFCPDRYANKSFKMTRIYCEKLLCWAANLAPNIEEVTIKRNHAFKMKITPERGTAKMLQYFSRMQNLNRLFVEIYSFKVSQILNLCKNLPSLQFLNVRFENSKCFRPSAEEIKSSLSNVKEFIFASKGLADTHFWLKILCIENLPNIEVVQFYCNDSSTKQRREFFFLKNFSETSNLRHANVEFNTHADVHTMFPNITDLMVDLEFYSERVNEASDSLFKFTKIKSLNLQILEACPFPIRDRFWETYGKNLHTLVLFSLYEKNFIDLNSVFKHCPKLEKLSLIHANIMMSQPTDFFAELKEFEWRQFPAINGCIDISNIVLAPKLEKIEIYSNKFNQEGLRKATFLIQEKKILKQLHTFHMHTYRIVDEILSDLLHELVKSACAFLPKLTKVNFSASNNAASEENYILDRYCHVFEREEDYPSTDPFMVYDRADVHSDQCILQLLDLFESY